MGALAEKGEEVRQMPGFEEMGKLLVFMGLFIVLVGLLLIFAPRVPLLGRLPGDIVIRKGNFSCFIPIATSILLSILLTLILNIVVRLLR